MERDQLNCQLTEKRIGFDQIGPELRGGKVCKEEYSGLIETQRESNPNGLGKRDR